MSQGRAVYRGNHGDFDVQKVGKQLLAFPVSLVPFLGRSLGRASRGSLGAGKGIAGSGHYDYPVLPVAAHVGEGAGKLLVGAGTPLQRPAVGVEGHLEDAVPPLEPNVVVLVSVLLQRDHGTLPPLIVGESLYRPAGGVNGWTGSHIPRLSLTEGQAVLCWKMI